MGRDGDDVAGFASLRRALGAALAGRRPARRQRWLRADADRPWAWPYRDFVIRALNTDLPFDRFVAWQIAGDELAPDDPEARAATGFLAAGESPVYVPTDTDENKREQRADEVDDWVTTTSAAFLGLTVGCARCHDHKFDPISAREYYALSAAFSNTQRRELPLDPELRRWQELSTRTRAAFRARKMQALGIPAYERMILSAPLMVNDPTSRRIYDQWNRKLAFTDDELVASLPPDEQARWRAWQTAAEGRPTARALMATDSSAEAEPTYLRRGDVRHRDGVVPFALLAALGGGDPGPWLPRPEPGASTTYRRAALARWLTDVQRGAGRLVARGAVNRIWQHHFGRGLVDTPNDFGQQTAEPVQIALLDFLAGKLVENGWRQKPVHALILASRVYQQGDRVAAQAARIDPENRLWWRRESLRLDAEAVRDALLTVAGALDESMYGPSVKAPIPKGAVATRAKDGYPTNASDEAARRRTVYLFAKRSVQNPLLEVFDRPRGVASCGRRNTTTVPTQALALLNGDFVRRRAGELAVRVEKETRPDPRARVRRAWALVYGRTIRPDEERAALRFLTAATLTDLAQVLFMTNEFLHVD